MGDSKIKDTSPSVRAVTLASGKAISRLTETGVLEWAAAIERACTKAEDVLNEAASILNKGMTVEEYATAARAIADGYLALAAFRKEAGRD